MVLDGLLGGDVTQLHVRPDRDDVLRDLLLRDHARGQEPLLEHRDAVLEQGLLVLGVVVLGVLGDVAELARSADPVRNFTALGGGEMLDLLP